MHEHFTFYPHVGCALSDDMKLGIHAYWSHVHFKWTVIAYCLKSGKPFNSFIPGKFLIFLIFSKNNYKIIYPSDYSM